MSLQIRVARNGTAGGYSPRATVNSGGIGSFLKGAVGGIARVAGNLLPGPLGTVARVAGTALAGREVVRGIMPVPPARRPALLPPPPQQAPIGAPLPGAGAQIARLLPGGATGRGTGCMSGFHPNKTAYFLRSGEFVDVGTRCVRNRRRNPLNPRALDRSLGRIASTGNALKRLGFKPPNPKKVATTGKKPGRRKK